MQTSPSAPTRPPLPSRGLLRWQKSLGWITMLILFAGFFSLADGLFAEMRRGPLRLDVLPGSLTALSGNVPIERPTREDFLLLAYTPPEDVPGMDAPVAPPATDTAPDSDGGPALGPPDPAVTLELEGFFSSYWFGSGMWRATLKVGDAPRLGEHLMIVRFKGAPKTSEQVYRVYVWPDAQTMQQGSFSAVTRHTGLSPFLLAASLLPLGLALLGGNWLLGRAWQGLLRRSHMAEVHGIKYDGDTVELTFALGSEDGVRLGQLCALYDAAAPDGGSGTGAARANALPECAPVSLCKPRMASVLLPRSTRLPATVVACPLEGAHVPMRSPLAVPPSILQPAAGTFTGPEAPKPARERDPGGAPPHGQ